MAQKKDRTNKINRILDRLEKKYRDTQEVKQKADEELHDEYCAALGEMDEEEVEELEDVAIEAMDDENGEILVGLLEPMDEIAGFKIRPGFFQMEGARITTSGISFTVSSQGATGCTLVLYHPKETKPYAEIPFPEEYHIGNTFSMLVYDLQIEDFEYAYRMDGPYQPEKGLLFDKNHILLDPYAEAVTGQREWGMRPKHNQPFEYHARVVNNTFEWGKTRQLEYPFEDLIIYELHVRGYTMDKSSGVKERGTYEGLRKKIPYLKDLGINAVELMPIFEFDEMENARVVNGVQLYNYWGYNTVSFFSPNTAYTYREEHHHEGDELKHLIRDLKENGIEVILDVVFNHTAEGDEHGPCFSFKGIDNNVYYMLTPDAKYYNFSGCGNAMNANHPIVRQFIMDCLYHWIIDYRVDGFRFDLASILGRDRNGEPMEHPPILEAMAYDNLLGKTKLIAEAWDAAGLYQVGSFPAYNRWAEWNGRYRDDMRRFLKGDPGMAGAAIERLTGSRDMYNPETRGTWASINFLTCHDGFTMHDLYSYNVKHNEGNGWNNTDGDNFSSSWNCGVEGETDDPKIIGLRKRLIKNAFAALMCSRGVPMFLAGDEFGNTQFGNNNAYCQDNIISWLDWTRLDQYREIHDFARFMIRFRKEHPILRKRTRGAECQFPEISIHNGYPNNHATDYGTHLIGVMYAGRDEKDEHDDVILYCMNSYWEPQSMQLPTPPQGHHWNVVVNTFCEYEDGRDFGAMTGFVGNNMISVPSRSTIILQLSI